MFTKKTKMMFLVLFLGVLFFTVKFNAADLLSYSPAFPW
ncbi:hypothetical protein CLROS_045510 (plasmid) [Clostridium felsineum]|uniref:Uncharacterized protein n=1 Tax=Clostridium felsineum TaxID=36839 RepID=A0A1S8KXG1_9CLOT|nr:hypothetical protein CLAUR_047030 [Clostridium felsineum]URZ09135.1 hypothetical protein CLROS_045510 [Clostridium felsineum]URZ13822.1 hypothetical protein CROST_046000 [Clostridium felsineum]URZ18646.1 hypothetical protein CLFE_047340 [Clostridium felsineum DSM 794]